jgi:hypothetical protein
MTLNTIKLESVVRTAKRSINSNHSLSRIEKAAWNRSITKAAQTLLDNPYISLLANGDVLMLSQSSRQLYVINGKCEDEKGQSCKGYLTYGVCYHRTIKRILERYQQS